MTSPPVRQAASEWLGIAVEIRGRCRACGNPVMVNAAVRDVTCPSCQKTISIPRDDWMRALARMVKGVAHGDVSQGGSMPLGDLGEPDIHWAAQGPLCTGCGVALETVDVPSRVPDGRITCVSCGAQAALRTLDGDLTYRSILAIGEDPDQLPSGVEGAAPPAAAEPVRFPCPSCGASLPVDGSKRTVTCEFCHTHAYLPDELWRRFHPVKTVRRWYLWADVGQMRAFEAAEQAEHDAAQARQRAVEAAEQARVVAAAAAAREDEEERSLRIRSGSWWNHIRLSLAGLAVGLAASAFSLAGEKLLPLELARVIGTTAYFVALAVSLIMLGTAAGDLGPTVRSRHYLLASSISVVALGCGTASVWFWLR